MHCIGTWGEAVWSFKVKRRRCCRSTLARYVLRHQLGGASNRMPRRLILHDDKLVGHDYQWAFIIVTESPCHLLPASEVDAAYRSTMLPGIENDTADFSKKYHLAADYRRDIELSALWHPHFLPITQAGDNGIASSVLLYRPITRLAQQKMPFATDLDRMPGQDVALT